MFKTGPSETLCSECADYECTNRGNVQACPVMMPKLTLRSLIGTDQRVFNTIRIAAAWAKRLQPLDVVVLTCKGEEVPCTVVTTFHGPFEEMFLQHSPKNHTALGNPDSSHVEVVWDALVKSYGKNWVLNSKLLSVIYLTPLKGK